MSGNVSGQYFRPQPIPNLRQARYGLTIVGPNSQPVQSYIFPLSPRNVRRQYVAMGNYYDVAGTAQQNGVNRIVDLYGNSPLTFLIEGTTGFQLHNTDGGQTTGIDSILNLQKMLNTYASLNQTAQNNNQSALNTLEFSDFYLGSFWQVEPIGEQGFHQDAQQSLYVSYQFRLVGIKDLNTGNPQNDALASTLTTTANSASTTLSTQMADIQTQYQAQTTVIA